MSSSCISAATLDDALRSVFREILNKGTTVVASKGKNLEIIGAHIEITNPRARLSSTETRGKPFSCMGELSWYLAGSDDTEFISYYIKSYLDSDEGGSIFGAYGPRLFGPRCPNQVENVINILKRKPTSRQAVIQLFAGEDIASQHRDTPCTCTIQLILRGEHLHMVTHMRSNDAFLGLPHDVFCFTMLQEIFARNLDVDIGSYHHFVGSLHVYDTHLPRVKQFVDEGWQSTQRAMPAMPLGDPWQAVKKLSELESLIRHGQPVEPANLAGMDAYWADLVRLLQVFRCHRNADIPGIRSLREEMSCNLYHPFIDRYSNVK